MNFTDMLAEMIENETGHLNGVEVVPAAPEGIIVGEELIS